MATRMLWFEVMPPFALYNDISVPNSENPAEYLRQNETFINNSYQRVLRFEAEFVNIDEVIKQLYNKTLTMQKYFNHPNAEIQYKENDKDPMSVTYYEVNLQPFKIFYLCITL